MHCGKNFKGVLKHIRNSLRRERFSNIFKGVAEECVRHKFSVEGQKYKYTDAVQFSHFHGGGNTVESLHINIHKYDRKTAGLKRVQKRLSAVTQNSFYVEASALAKVMADTYHFIEIVIFIIH